MFVSPDSADRAAGCPQGAAPLSIADSHAIYDGLPRIAPGASFEGPDAEAMSLDQARRMIQFIAVSRDLLPGLRELADHPGWEIMLHLFVANREGRAITTTNLCDITGCWRPLTVRYVELLFERGMVERDLAAGNQDDQNLRLTRDASEKLTMLLCGFTGGWDLPAINGQN